MSPLSQIISAVSHVNRLTIIELLKNHEYETGQIVREMKLPGIVIAHHLRILKQTGWISRIRIGKKVTYRIEHKNFREMIRYFAPKNSD